MDLTDYDGLQAAIADYLNRPDLTSQIPGFIALCEAKLRRELRAEVVRDELLLDGPEVELPADCAELRGLTITEGGLAQNAPVAFVDPVSLANIRRTHLTVGIPRYAAVVDNTLLLAPGPSEEMMAEVRYYARLESLDEGNPTTSLLTEHPDVYLYGALAEAEPFLEHDERVALWKAMYQESLDSVNRQRERREFGSRPTHVRLPRVF